MNYNLFSSLIVPLIICITALIGISKNCDVFSVFTEGAKDGLKVTIGILPSLIGLLVAVYMLRASGFIDALASLLTPVFRFIGIPTETALLVLLRPFTGSGALAIGSEIISEYGADSLVGRTAAVMLGSTETTFYVISIYFGSLGVKKLRHTVPAALAADLTGFITASLIVKIIWG